MSDLPENPTPEPAERIEGPLGFRAGGIAAGIKPSGAPDLAAIVCDHPAVAVGLTTTNQFRGAPVRVTAERLASAPRVRGVLVNAGIANVLTGPQGLEDARAMASIAEQQAGAAAGEFLVASTGVIGPPLPMDTIRSGAPRLFGRLAPDGWAEFARAIMTTDTRPKLARRVVKLGRGQQITILGAAKGVGMIHPEMATMLGFLATDYPIGPGQARAVLGRVADQTFNRVTVDGDMSTSDMLLLLSSGLAIPGSEVNASRDEKFEGALLEVAEELTREIARDGEGAEHLITIEVTEARNEDEALRVARSVARSPLVKTAIFGKDPNCMGRICAAAGAAGVTFDPQQVTVRLQGTQIVRGGVAQKFDREKMSAALAEPEVAIEIRLGEGKARQRVWTCDLTYDYVRINAEYTT